MITRNYIAIHKQIGYNLYVNGYRKMLIAQISETER